MMAIAMIAAFVVNLLLGLPLFLCLLLTALVGFLFVDPALFANTLPQRFFGGMDIFSLMAIPLFVLAGNLMNHSGMTPRLMRLANALVGHFNNQLLVAELYQHLHRGVGKRRPLRRFDSVIQQVANNRNQLLFPQRQERPVQPTGRVETQLDPFLPRAGGFPQQQAAQVDGEDAAATHGSGDGEDDQAAADHQ